MSRSRAWAFTLNNTHELAEIKGAVYVIQGKEKAPTTGTPHVQGYAYFENARGFKAFKSLLPNGAHVEVAKGTALQNRVYCCKEGSFEESGTCPQQGRRADISDLYDLAKAGKSDIEIGESNPAAYLRYYKACDRVRFNYACRQVGWKKVTVRVYWGETGTGKTRKAYKRDPHLFQLDHDSIGQLWWDGYVDQKTVLLDDYYGGIQHSKLLRLLDGNGFSLPIKGGHTWKQYECVIITSNAHPREWYPGGLSAALARRLGKIREIR